MPIPFHCFCRVDDGVWTCTRSADFTHKALRVTVTAGALFKLNESYMGVDLVRELEDERVHQQKLHSDHLALLKLARTRKRSPARPDAGQPETREGSR